MNNFYELVEFYGIYINFVEKSVQKVVLILNYDHIKAESLIHQVAVIDLIKDLLEQYPDGDISFLIKEAKLSKEDLCYYLTAIEILFPTLIRIKNIFGNDKTNALLATKKKAAINFFIKTTRDDQEIADRLNVKVSEIEIARKNLPIIREENLIVQKLRAENKIREFFTIYPYSTIVEASKFLQIKSQILRSVVEQLRVSGEDIKFNNVPKIFEQEEISRKVIKIKTEEPAITNSEISLQLGIPVSEVKRAIQNAVKIWQIEKADNYDFHFNKTSTGLDNIEKEAWAQHEKANGGRPSSRWLEIALMAMEKRIAMHGLKAPERLDIRQEIRMTKEEKDNVIEAAMAADTIDIDFEKIEVTGRENA